MAVVAAEQVQAAEVAEPRLVLAVLASIGSRLVIFMLAAVVAAG
jgi:hypothetical protein